MAEQGCLPNEKYHDLEVSNILKVNKLKVDKLIYDFETVKISGQDLSLNKAVSIYTENTVTLPTVVLPDGIDGQIKIIINRSSKDLTVTNAPIPVIADESTTFIWDGNAWLKI